MKSRYVLAAVLLVWVAGWAAFRGQQTLAVGGADMNSFHLWLDGVRDAFDASRADNPFFVVIGAISDVLDWLVTSLQHLFSQAPPGRPVPQIGWLGTFALLVWTALATAGWRSALLVAGSLLAFGLLGYWQDSIDLLIVTFIAVLVCVVIGVPLGIWMAKSRRATAVLTPVLDVMQTMPSFAYLTPLVLFFGIGAASAIVVSAIYALPPVIRVTAHGVRSVSAGTVEASRSLGVSGWQLLHQVQLPMARSTIIVGVNQCMMAALSMATIAALVNGPGLGKPVMAVLQSLDIGTATGRACPSCCWPSCSTGRRAGLRCGRRSQPGPGRIRVGAGCCWPARPSWWRWRCTCPGCSCGRRSFPRPRSRAGSPPPSSP